MGQVMLGQLPQKAPLYTYAAAKIAVSNTDDDIFKATSTTKSMIEEQYQAYESVVRGQMNNPNSAFPGR